jgi:hypothetical protein
MTRFARHERAQHAGFQINPFDLKPVLTENKHCKMARDAVSWRYDESKQKN